MTDEPDRFHVGLVISDFEPAQPSAVTELLGVEPTRAWGKGDRDPAHPTARRTFSTWELRSPVERTAPFEDQLDALLPLLEARADQIRAAKERWSASVACAAYFYKVNPGFSLSEAHLARLTALGLGLDLDLYCLREPTVEEDEE